MAVPSVLCGMSALLRQLGQQRNLERARGGRDVYGLFAQVNLCLTERVSGC